MSNTDIEPLVTRREKDFPAAARLTREVYKMSPTILGSQIPLLDARWGDKFWQRAERLTKLAESIGGHPAESLVEFTVENVKAQAMFVETRNYAQSDFETARREVYDNPQVMEGFYLEGLLMSHAYWPIHFDLHEFFMEEFLPRVPDRGVGAEYAFGHGLYLLEVLQNRPNTRVSGFDLSPYSRKYAGRILEAGGIDSSRYELGFADVREAFPCEDNAYSWAIFAEIIEHIPDPLFSLKELRRALEPGAPLFAVTVVDANAIDHLYQFEDVEAIRSMMREAGFKIVSEKVMRVTDYMASSPDPSIDVALVAVPD
jgi:hypothetical protein